MLSPLHIDNKEIRRVAIIDDQLGSRESMEFNVEDADLYPVPQNTKIGSLEDFLLYLTHDVDAAIFDHHLSPGNYAGFYGAQAVAELYKQGFPALLVTNWANTTDMQYIRPYRQNIPVLLRSTNEVNSEKLKNGLILAVHELNKKYTPERRPHNTGLLVVDVDSSASSQNVYVIVPAWHPTEVIQLPLSMLPIDVKNQVQVDTCLVAQVNIGATHQDDLYFTDIILAPALDKEYAQFLHS